MYNSGNSSKNVTGASIVDGTVETVDIADDAVTVDKLANAINTDIATGVSASTTAGAALPKAGGTMTGALTTTRVNTSDGISDTGSGGSETVFNDSGSTANFRVESTTDTNMFFVDGGLNKIGIGTNTPATALDVVGQVRASTGILFGTDTAAANALDDYEEGTWTPEYFISGTDFDSVTYDIQGGYYTKIGNTVHCTLQLRTDAITVGSASGSAQITGLPFTSSSSQGFGPGKYDDWTTPPKAFDISSGQNVLQLRVENSTSSLTQTSFKTGTNDNLLSLIFHYNA